jgi:polar amino acid transport system substrate-binding protein
VDDDGRPAGRDVEMMQLLGALLGRRLEWRRMPFDQLLDAVARGEVDVVCATLGITAERAQRVTFTMPYFETTIAVVVRAGDGEPDSLAALAGRRVAAATGTTSQSAVQRRLPAAVGVFENKQQRTTADRLLSGEIDAAVMDGPAADALVAASQGRARRLDENLGAESYALALPRTATALALKGQLNNGLRHLRASGQLSHLDSAHGLVAP